MPGVEIKDESDEGSVIADISPAARQDQAAASDELDATISSDPIPNEPIATDGLTSSRVTDNQPKISGSVNDVAAPSVDQPYDRQHFVPPLSRLRKDEAPLTPVASGPTHVSGSGHLPEKKKFSSHYIIEIFLFIVIIILTALLWNFYTDKQNLQKEVANLNANPQALVERQSQGIIGAVGRLMQLPTNETPTVATVSNAAAAKAQSSFFAKAENGDKVLLYVKAGEAILYRPRTNKIVLVAPLTFSSPTSGTSTTTSTPTPKTVK